MEKQYSVEFFNNFVDNLQSLCHSFLDFDQYVEVSGYICLELDNTRKERYVLSEMIQATGRSISESYCTKAFKSSPSVPYKKCTFQDVTNRQRFASGAKFSQSQPTSERNFIPNTPSGHKRAAIPSLPANAQRSNNRNHGYSSSVPGQRRPSNFATNQKHSDETALQPNEQKGYEQINKRHNDFEHHTTNNSSNETSPIHISDLSNDNTVIDEPSTSTPKPDIETKEEFRELDTNKSPASKSSPVSRGGPTKRPHSASGGIKSEPESDGEVFIVKEEPGDKGREDDGEPPPKKMGESVYLPDSFAHDQSMTRTDHTSRCDDQSDDEFQDTVTNLDFTSQLSPDIDMFSTQPTSKQIPLPSLDGVNTAAILGRIKPAPIKVSTPSGPRYTCQLCRNTVENEIAFVMHMNTHPSCKECGRFVATHMDLRDHVQKEHGHLNMFKCKFCEKVFLTRSGMLEHRRIKHENRTPKFVCPYCMKVCVRKIHLDNHVANVHEKNQRA